MSASARVKRMARNHRRLAKPARLNLVALMDIFTILVLFLIVNHGDVEVLQKEKHLVLPDSVSEQRPEAAVVVTVNETEILLDGKSVITLEAALDGSADAIAPLAEALEMAAAMQPQALEEDDASGRSIVIMGDKSTSYALLKRIMATCAETDFREISLAVNSMPAQMQAPSAPALAMSGVGS